MKQFTQICLITLLCLAFLKPGAVWAMSSEVQQIMLEGIALHNIGEYSAAIDTYLQALQSAPDEPIIYYELGYSYFAAGQFDKCIAAAQEGLSLQPAGNLEPGLYVLQGSCYSTDNRFEEALTAFRAGLAKYPNHTGLNYNIAITLTKTQQYAEAIAHVKTAVIQSPDYASSYFLLAQLYEAQAELVPSLAYYLRFAMLEQNTTRTRYAAYSARVLAHVGIVVERDGEYYIRRSADDSSTLLIGLKMAMLSQETDAAKSRAAKFVNGLTSFLRICSELNDEELRNSFVWEYALGYLVSLHEHGHLDAFLYYLASQEDLLGADAWLQAHPNAVRELLDFLR
jgi:tetratricopeptide (TPR) repeat protein